MAAMEITPIPWDGEKISKPGIFADLPMSVYHGDCCVGPSISSTGLRTIFHDGAAAYWMRSPYNPQRLPEKQKPHFNLGAAAHTLLLSQEGFGRDFAVRPSIWPDWKTKASREWRDEMVAAGKIVLTEDDLETIRGMAGLLPWQKSDADTLVPESGLANSSLVGQGLLQGQVELSIIWQDEETGVWLKARPDLLSGVDGIIVDPKTCSKDNPSKAIWEHRYHQQGALVGEGLLAVADWEMSAFVLVFMQTTPPYSITVHELVPYQDQTTGEMVDPIGIGMRQNRHAIKTFARCMKDKRWPAASGDAHEERMPLWYLRQVERALQPQPELEAA